MSIYSCILLSVLSAATIFGAVDPDTQAVSFNAPVQIPEAVLQPGKYTIHLEDQMADRAIVRITEANGTDHYVLSVPSKKLTAESKGLVFFPDSTGAAALSGWGCNSCKRPLEFVYPKDEAVKLTADTGKPILAYDPSYDKLPANLSPADRKVVTLWLLAPKTVTSAGKGEGLTAAKYSVPKVMAAAEPLPKTMPKTASNAFLELLVAFLSLIGAIIAFLWHKVSALHTSWKIVTITGGLLTGLALTMAATNHPRRVYAREALQAPDRDSEVERAKTHQRRLEAMLETLSERKAGE
jgi:hypothetical protein